jgi:MFS family permease
MNEKKTRLFYGYVVTAAGFTIMLVGGGTYTPSFGVFLKPIVDEFGWARAQASLGYSLSVFVQGLLAIGMGWLTDKLGPRLVAMVLGSFLGICYILMSEVTALWQFQLNYAFFGAIGASTVMVPIMATVSRWFIRRRGLMLGIVQAGLALGGLLFPPVAGRLILSYGWRTAYLITGVITIGGMILAGFFLRRDPRDMGLSADDGEDVLYSQAKETAMSLRGGVADVTRIMKHRSFWMMAGVYGIFGFCRTTFTSHVTAHVQDLGFSITQGANALAIIAGSSMFARVGMGRLADKIGNIPGFIISFAITALSLVLGLFAQELWMIYLFSFIFGVGWGNQAVLRYSLTSEVFGLRSIGLILGVLAVGEALAAACGSYFAGYLFDLSGSYRAVFWMGIVISLLGAFLVGLLKPMVRAKSGGSSLY